jgi:hypothetical protein
MYTREVSCGVPECENAAAYKIAAPWSSGKFTELKSYGLACADHYGLAFRNALQRARKHVYSDEESVGEIGIYYFEKGTPDKQLQRLKNLEQSSGS